MKWDEIPVGRKGVIANVLKGFLNTEGIRGRAECAIEIKRNAKETLKKSYDSEFSSCYNAFASGVKLEVVD